MKIVDFNINDGIYNFELTEVDTTFHAHPVVEIICAKEGTFTLATDDATYTDAVFAIIDANIKHKLSSDGGRLTLLMLENNNFLFHNFLEELSLNLHQGVLVDITDQHQDEFNQLLSFARQHQLKDCAESRVQKCLELLKKDDLDYHKMMDELQGNLFLSESRLSHLFKKHIGTSLKKYLVWCKLKKAIHLMLHEDINLVEASFRSGFYDQAHLSNAFKNMFGISPSKEYNSRTLQF